MTEDNGTERRLVECIECGGAGDLPDATICEVCEGSGEVCAACMMPEDWCDCLKDEERT